MFSLLASKEDREETGPSGGTFRGKGDPPFWKGDFHESMNYHKYHQAANIGHD
jgi:hypothetical protein